jgi:hypothetical protein
MKRIILKVEEWAAGFRPIANSSICALIMVLAIGLVTVSCGKDDDGDNGGKDETEKVTADNWKKVIKDVYGFDLNVPSGWTFKEGAKTGTNPVYLLKFTTAAADYSAEFAAFMQYMFDLTAAVTPADGNFDVSLISGEKGNKYENIPTIMDKPSPLWYFNTSKDCIQVSLGGASATKVAEINLTYIGAKK